MQNKQLLQFVPQCIQTSDIVNRKSIHSHSWLSLVCEKKLSDSGDLGFKWKTHNKSYPPSSSSALEL